VTTEAACSIVIVAYHSAALLPACLAAIPKACPVIVVDNASPDASAEVALAARPSARVIRAARDLGFGPGANLGFADPVFAEALAARSGIGHNGRLENFYGAGVFLCSDAAAHVTGQILAVDGGFTAK